MQDAYSHFLLALSLAQLNQEQGRLDRDYYLQKLDQIESRARLIKLPISYSQYLYELRSHIEFVRSKI